MRPTQLAPCRQSIGRLLLVLAALPLQRYQAQSLQAQAGALSVTAQHAQQQASLDCPTVDMQPCGQQCCHRELACSKGACVPACKPAGASTAPADQPCWPRPAASSGLQVFYHVAALNQWEDIVRAQADRIAFSGLYAEVDTIHCFVMGPSPGAVAAAQRLLVDYGRKFLVLEATMDMSPAERFTLHKLRYYIRPSDRVLYLHTKGVTHPRGGQPPEENFFFWTWAMMYFLVAQFRRSLAELERVDAVGVQFLPQPFQHFSGNFWWARGGYVLQLELPIPPGHLPPEAWLLTKNGNVSSLWGILMPPGPWLNNMKALPRWFLDPPHAKPAEAKPRRQAAHSHRRGNATRVPQT